MAGPLVPLSTPWYVNAVVTSSARAWHHAARQKLASRTQNRAAGVEAREGSRTSWFPVGLMERAGDGWSAVRIGPGNFDWLAERLRLMLNSSHLAPIFQPSADDFLQDASRAD